MNRRRGRLGCRVLRDRVGAGERVGLPGHEIDGTGPHPAALLAGVSTEGGEYSRADHDEEREADQDEEQQRQRAEPHPQHDQISRAHATRLRERIRRRSGLT